LPALSAATCAAIHTHRLHRPAKTPWPTSTPYRVLLRTFSGSPFLVRRASRHRMSRSGCFARRRPRPSQGGAESSATSVRRTSSLGRGARFSWTPRPRPYGDRLDLAILPPPSAAEDVLAAARAARRYGASFECFCRRLAAGLTWESPTRSRPAAPLSRPAARPRDGKVAAPYLTATRRTRSIVRRVANAASEPPDLDRDGLAALMAWARCVKVVPALPGSEGLSARRSPPPRGTTDPVAVFY